MFRFVWIAASLLLLLDADVPRVFRLKPQSGNEVEFPAGASLPVLPDLSQAPAQQAPGKKAERLRPESRLDLVRYISGEFVRAVRALPAGKKAFRIKAGRPVDENALRQAVASNGSNVNPGDTVQITRLVFRENELVFELNGGGRQKKRWRDRIHIEAGGVPTVTSTPANSAPGFQGQGATLVLDFGRPLPDLTPDEVKQYLAGVLDFSKQRSASVQWVETLPPEFQTAIKERRAVVGMDREMVQAAMGKPQRKVRERDLDGVETEDWIYGEPPQKTIFVRFVGDKVVSVKQYP
jgi:hypothetical protein